MAGLEVVATDGELVLRQQSLADLDRHMEAVDDAQIDWLWEPGHRELWEAMSSVEQREHQRRHLQAVHDSFGSGPKWCFSVDTPDAAYVVYIDCDLANPHVPTGQANISYTCHPTFRGRGYTARAVRLVCDFLRERTTASEAFIVVQRDNRASLGAVGAVEQDRFVDEHGRTMIRHVLSLRG
jgi:RimJ/RimL family protein N-acetyltransferase